MNGTKNERCAGGVVKRKEKKKTLTLCGAITQKYRYFFLQSEAQRKSKKLQLACVKDFFFLRKDETRVLAWF